MVAEGISGRRWRALLAVLATAASVVVVVGGTTELADASTCDATIVVEQDLRDAIDCYNLELAGSVTVVQLANDVTLTVTPELNNATTATFTIDGQGNTLTSKTSDVFNDDGIELSAGTLILDNLEYDANTYNGIRMSADTSLELEDSTVIADEATTALRAGFDGTSISLVNSEISGSIGEAISISGTLTMVDSAIIGPRGAVRGFGGSDIAITNSTLLQQGTSFGDAALTVDGTATLVGVSIIGYANGVRGTGAVDMQGVLIPNGGSGSCRTAEGLVITDGGGNVVDGTTCAPIVGQPNDYRANVGLGSIDDNGCHSSSPDCVPSTVEIGFDSPAIDAWPGCSLSDDQRGFPRPAGACDAGAYEAQESDCPATVATEAELRTGISCYNAYDADRTLTLSTGITLTEALPVIDGDSSAVLTINGGSATIIVPNDSTGFNMIGGNLTLNNVTVTGASTGINLNCDCAVSLIDTALTAIANSAMFATGSSNTASLSMLRSTLDGNEDAVQNFGGPVNIDFSTITNSSDTGIRVGNGSASITNSTISATFYGVVTGPGGTTITNSTLADNVVALDVQSGTNLVTSTSLVRNSLRGFSVAGTATGTTTFVDSLSVNNNGGCGGDGLDAVVVDGGGNVHNGGPSADNGCGPIPVTAGASVGDLPALAQNPCATEVPCTATVALPAGFPAAGAGAVCAVPVDQRGVSRPSANCDAGAYELANQTPTPTSDSFGSVITEDDPATPLDVLDNDTDPDNEPLVVTVATLQDSSQGTLTVDGDGLGVMFTPAQDVNGTVVFDYTVSDPLGGTASTTASVSISPVNDPPVAEDDTGAAEEDGPNVTLDVLDNDFDVDSASFTINSASQPDPLTAGRVFRSGDQTQLIFEPSEDYAGDSEFTYTLIDSSGAVSEPATVTMTTTERNDSPVAFDDVVPGFTLQEDDDPTVLDVLANDTDLDDANLFVSSVTGPGSGGTAAVVNGELVFTPALDFNGGVPIFSYEVSDGRGGTDTADVRVSITAVNDPPVANDDEGTTEENIGFARINVRTNDTDVENQTLTVVDVTDPAVGTVRINGPQELDFTFPENFVGEISVEYTIQDSQGASDTATATLTVTAVNDAPVAFNDSELVDEDSIDNVIDVLANDTDEENDTLQVTAVTQPPNGTVSIGADGANVLYTPDPGFNPATQNPDVFEYTMSDGNGGADSATVTVFVLDTSQPPVANDDRFIVVDIPVAQLDVLANDSDPAGGQLEIIDLTVPFPIDTGEARISSDKQTIEFISLQAFDGEARITYTIENGEGLRRTAFAFVTMSPGVACNPNYQPCLPIVDDLNCSDLDVTVRVVGEDPYGLDRDGNGVACGDDPPRFLLCAGEIVTIDLADGGGGVGTDQRDVILGTPGRDFIDGRGGDDLICAGAGNDNVQGGPGADTIFGGDGNDKLFGAQGFDEIFGEDGDDVIHGNRGDDRLFGGEGDDRIFGYAHDDLIEGGPGADRLHGNFGDDVVRGNSGDDRMFGYGDNDELSGGLGDDLISGNFGDDVIDGGEDDDILFGADGDDVVNGGPGDDQVNGNSLNDTISGGPGNDTLDGGINVDTCAGDAGIDTATRCETVTGVP